MVKVFNEIIGVIGGASIHSNKVCVTGKSDDIPSTVENITASVNNNNAVEISWNKPPGMSVKAYKLLSSIDNNSSEIYSGNESSYIDTRADPATSVICYSVAYLDLCDNSSLISLPACPVLLSGQIINNNHYKLSWTGYQGWENGVKEYILQIINEEGDIIKEVSLGTSLEYEDLDQNQFQVVRYRIKSISNDPLPLVSFSNIFEIKQNFVIALPNAFTPNGDGLNDRFEVKKTYIRSVRMYIYNKWGALIFEGENWDGMAHGRKSPEGVYVYDIEAEDETGAEVRKRGTVVLIR